jgi:hypothetical protein
VRAEGGGGAVDTETETLAVRQPITVSSPLAANNAPKAEVGLPFSVAQTAAGGEGTFTWSLGQGALPSGLTLQADGTIAGTPAVAGRFQFTVTVTDREGRSAKMNVTLVVAPKLAFKSATLRKATVGHAYRAKVAIVGGVRPITWTIRGKLPRGLKFTKATGTFSGTPRAAGKFRITLQAVDALGVTAQKTLTLVVAKA